MSKRIAWLAAASLSVASVALGYWQYREANKPVFFRGHGFVSTPVFRRSALLAGNHIEGPALVEEHASTTVVQPGDKLTVDELGNLQITIGSDRT
jgi:N-methylhydantoinase A